MEHLRLSDGEWKLMKALWSRQPQTLAELVAALDAETGWSRATIFMMLKRLIAKGAVTIITTTLTVIEAFAKLD